MDEMDFELLNVLNDTKNITRASEQLFITQPALSKRIKAIEHELGVEVLIRSKQGVRFTPAGEAVLSHCMTAASEMDKMRRELETASGCICGTLNAAFSINFSQYRLPDVLAKYNKEYPAVKLHITTGRSQHLYRQVMEGNFDVAVLRGEYPWDGMKFMLAQERICLIYSKEHEGTPLEDLLYISHRTDIQQSSQISRWLHEQGLNTKNSSFCVDNLTTCVEMVKHGLGWGIIPEIALEDFDGCKKPCVLANGEPLIRRTYIFCSNEAAKLPQVEAFIDLLKKTGEKLEWSAK